ncbi:acetylcholinesterase [Dermacentor silvarum]|uniref:acetylcholinesterase n=1 Tax=Dermacentor silvarum TaxID=543639 RepID=UPI002101007E|nr:acetylcholinesterase [Dermacentor silvarum]
MEMLKRTQLPDLPTTAYKSDGAEGAVRLATSLQCPADLVTEASLRCLQNASVDAVARSKMAPRFAPVFNRAPLTSPQIRERWMLSLVTATVPRATQLTGPQGKEFLLGRVEREGAYPWFLEQQRSGTGDPQQLAARLVGYEMLERWQNATGVALDVATSDATYQEAVGDVLEACPMSELAEQLRAWKNRVYAYVLGYRPTYSSWTEETEAVHFEDMELVFGLPLTPDTPSGELDKQWSRTMIRVWSTFARTGRMPVLMTTKWPEFDMLRLATIKLGPKEVTGQRDPKWQRCRALRDSSATASLS